jgi:hypothetical protein
MPAHTLNVLKDSPLYDKLLARLRSRVDMGTRKHTEMYQVWKRAEELTVAYVPEQDYDRARSTARTNGQPKYTTIQIPYTYALLLSAHTYWTSVFFARTPVHQFSGRHGEAENSVMALEALVGYQVEVGGFMGPYYIWLYDVGKYGVGILGEYWTEERLQYGQLVEQLNEDGTSSIMQVTKEVDGYKGNKVYNVSPYDFMHDPRVPIGRFQDGEFCVARKRMMWHDLEARKQQGYYVNLDLLEGHLTDKGQSDGSSEIIRPQFDVSLADMDPNGNAIKYKSGGVFYEVYVKLSPKDWGLGNTTYPQTWCFTITEDCNLLIGVTPVGYAHCKFPFTIGESEVEGYGTFNRGIPEINEPLQNVMDWLINTHFYNVRASLNNQFIVDPSKLVVKDVQNAGPGFIWRLRPEAYGTDIRSMMMQVPVTDVTRGNMQDVQLIQGMSERALGINDSIMGVLNTQNRKTATEVRTSTGFGVNRQKTITEYLSATAFSPHAQRIVQNTQQFYDGNMKLKIAGSLMQEASKNLIEVDPNAIAGFYDFVPVDGALPIDRMAQANLWKEMMGSLRFMPPQVMAEYDWSRIFGWVATIAGLKNVNQFKIQTMPPEQLAMQAQAGNVVPLRPQIPPPMGGSVVSPGNSASTAAGLNAMGDPDAGGL